MEGWGEKTYNCNWITIKILKKENKEFENLKKIHFSVSLAHLKRSITTHDWQLLYWTALERNAAIVLVPLRLFQILTRLSLYTLVHKSTAQSDYSISRPPSVLWEGKREKARTEKLITSDSLPRFDFQKNNTRIPIYKTLYSPGDWSGSMASPDWEKAWCNECNHTSVLVGFRTRQTWYLLHCDKKNVSALGACLPLLHTG